MPIVPENAPSSTPEPDGADYEPDDEWKLQLSARIDAELLPMVEDAKENQAVELRMAPDTPETHLRVEAAYKQTMQNIQSLATEQYQFKLDRERYQRRWTAGVPWTLYCRQEPQNITHNIKQNSSQTDDSVRTVNKSPTGSVSPQQSVRQGYNTSSRDRDEPSGSFRQAAMHHERPGLWVATDTVEEPEEVMRSPLPRARLPSINRPSPSPVSPDRWDGSTGRSSGSIHSTGHHLPRPPPRPPPEVKRPAIPPLEDPFPETYSLRSRKSAASMRSTKSGASIRSRSVASMRSTGSGASIQSVVEGNDYLGIQKIAEQGGTRIPIDKLSKKERPRLRGNSRQSPVDAGHRYDELGGSSGLRSLSSIMQYTTSPLQSRPLSTRPLTFTNNDRRHPSDTPGNPPPYQPSGRSSSYGADDRDHGPPYSTPHTPHGPKSLYLSQPGSQPISRQASFSHRSFLDVDDDDDDDERDLDRGGGDRESVYSEPRRTGTYLYPTPRHSSDPPPGSSRPAPQGYINTADFHDDRSEAEPRPSRGKYIYPNNLLDDWDYKKAPDSARPSPSRQPSDVRPSEDPDRKIFAAENGYTRHHPPAGSLPIPLYTPGFGDAPAQLTRREWATEGNRHQNYDYHQQRRSALNVEPFSHRRSTQPPPSYRNSPHGDYPGFGGRKMDWSSHDGNSKVADEYDSDEDTDSEHADGSQYEMETQWRELQAKKMREAEDKIRRTVLEIQKLAKEDVRKREKEVRRKEEAVKRKEEEAVKKEEEVRRKEREAERREQDAKKQEAAAKREEEEATQKAEELSRTEEQTRQRAAQLEEDIERAKRMELQAQKIAEVALQKQDDLKKMEEEARKKDMEMRERADILRQREEDLMRREADNFRREKEIEKEEAGKATNNTLVAGGAFNFAEGDIHINSSGKSTADKGIAKLFLNVASGAFHDSGERFDPPKCHPNTRAVVIQEILDWLDDPESPELVMWLHGATGAGKSAIAQSIAQMLCEQGRLSGSFFFPRGSSTGHSGRGDEKRLVPTLAYQLAKYLSETRVHIARAVLSDPAIFDLSLLSQVQNLLINPLSIASNAASSSSSSNSGSPRLFIIDGLDECRDADRILQVFAAAVKFMQYHLPHKLLMTSRSEEHLLAGCNEHNNAAVCRRDSITVRQLLSSGR